MRGCFSSQPVSREHRPRRQKGTRVLLEADATVYPLKELLDQKVESFKEILPPMVKLFQGIDGEQMLELADFFVHVVETTMDTFWVDGLHLYHDLAKRREDQAAWSGLADMDLIQQVLAHPQEEMKDLMAIAKTCLQGPKFRVTPEEFNELEQLNSFQQLLYKVQEHQQREVEQGEAKAAVPAVPPVAAALADETPIVANSPVQDGAVRAIYAGVHQAPLLHPAPPVPAGPVAVADAVTPIQYGGVPIVAPCCGMKWQAMRLLGRMPFFGGKSTRVSRIGPAVGRWRFQRSA
eukprot:g22767.t2